MRNKYYQLAALAVLLSGCNSNDYTADTQKSLNTPSYPVNNKTNSNSEVKRLDSVIYESFEQRGWNAENTSLSISTHQPGLNRALPKNFLFTQFQGPHSFSVESSIARFGSFSAKLHWQHDEPQKYNGDPQVLDNTDRKAMFHGHKASTTLATVWYGFSAYFPSEQTQLEDGQGALFFQIHGARDKNKEPNRIPPLSINLVENGFNIGYSWDSKKTSTSSHGEDNETFDVPAKLAEYQDRWVDFVIKVKTDPFENNGAISIWVDGKQMVNRTHIKIGYNDDMGVYPSFGWYLWGKYVNRNQDMIMYLDEVRQAEGEDINYHDVAPKAN